MESGGWGVGGPHTAKLRPPNPAQPKGPPSRLSGLQRLRLTKQAQIT